MDLISCNVSIAEDRVRLVFGNEVERRSGERVLCTVEALVFKSVMSETAPARVEESMASTGTRGTIVEGKQVPSSHVAPRKRRRMTRSNDQCVGRGGRRGGI